MEKQVIYWACTGNFDTLVGALKTQAIRMDAAGFHVEVASNGTGWLFSSPEFGNFELLAQQTHGVIESAQKTDSLALLLMFGVYGQAGETLLLAGPDGKQFSNSQRLQAIKSLAESLSPYDTALLQFVCGLMTPEIITECRRTPHASAISHPPLVRF